MSPNLGAAYRALGWAQWQAGDFSSAATNYQHALDIFRQLNDVPGGLDTALNLSTLQRNQGAFEDAVITLRAAELTAQQTDDATRLTQARALLAAALLDLAMGQVQQQEFDAALNTLHEAEQRALQSNQSDAVNLARTMIGKVLFEKDPNPEQSLRYHLQMATTSAPADQAGYYLQAAELSLLMHRLPDAQKYFETALHSFEEQGVWQGQALCHAGLAQLYLMQGNSEETQKEYGLAAACYARIR